MSPQNRRNIYLLETWAASGRYNDNADKIRYIGVVSKGWTVEQMMTIGANLRFARLTQGVQNSWRMAQKQSPVIPEPVPDALIETLQATSDRIHQAYDNGIRPLPEPYLASRARQYAGIQSIVTMRLDTLQHRLAPLSPGQAENALRKLRALTGEPIDAAIGLDLIGLRTPDKVRNAHPTVPKLLLVG